LTATALTLAQSVEITAAIAEALAKHIVTGSCNRDVKPSNIVVTERGQVKVLDFGLVKELHEPISQPATPRLQLYSLRTPAAM